MRPRACLLIAALSLLPAAEALAEAPEEAAAKEQFRQGREAVKQGDYKAALPLFRKSQETYPTPGTLLNLASCEEKLGLFASARQHFQQAVAQLPERDDRVPFAKQSIAALDPRVPRLRIKLAPGAAAGTHVQIDDAPVSPATIDTEIRVDPGGHVIVVSASDLPDRRYEVALKEGESSAVTVEPGARTASVGSNLATPPEAASGSGRRVAGFVIGGFGLAGIGVGAVTGVMALSVKSDLEKQCPVPSACTMAGVDKASTGKTLSLVSTVGFIAGGVGVGAGILLVLTSGNSAAKPATTLSISALPGGGAVGFGGRF